MSVYIEGMAMPKDGRYTLCITQDLSGNVHWVFQNEDTYEFLKHGRVKELPPHGRLIDADALSNTIEQHNKHLKISRYDRDLLLHYLDVEMAPTIIPAEEGET